MLSPADEVFLKIMADALNVNAEEVAIRMGVDSVTFEKRADGSIGVHVYDGKMRDFVLRLADDA